MAYLQILANGIVLGALYACLAVGFSLVWGVLNVINMLHGSLIILGGYLTFFSWHRFGINPLVALPAVALVLYAIGYLTQLVIINPIVTQPVLTTLTLTFGLDLILYNFMTVYYTATPRRVTLDLGIVDLGGIVMPVDRLLAMGLALLLTGLLYVDAAAEDLHDHLKTVDAPLNRLGSAELCPGQAALEAINAELR